MKYLIITGFIAIQILFLAGCFAEANNTNETILDSIESDTAIDVSKTNYIWSSLKEYCKEQFNVNSFLMGICFVLLMVFATLRIRRRIRMSKRI